MQLESVKDVAEEQRQAIKDRDLLPGPRVCRSHGEDELPAQCLGEANQFVSQLFDPFDNFLVRYLITFKGAPSCINKPRNDDTPKVEHKAISKCHHRHVTAHPARRAKEPDYFIFPGAPC